jgi:hypothetical protein
MKRLLQLAVVAGLAGAVFSGAARAQSLDWSYSFSNGQVLSGVFTGTDAGNDFTVTGLQSLSVDGVATTYLAGVPIVSFDALSGHGEGYNGNGSAVVTLDGSYMDLADTPDNGYTGIFFYVGDVFAQSLVSGAGIFVIPGYGSDGNEFAQADWSATLVGAQVPEPSTAAVLLTGVIGLAIVRGRKMV